jgi:tRNA1(Val) A37 N6-methylase TrmN6
MDAERREERRARLRAGWTPPGPRAAGPREDLRPGEGETLDALVGDWCVFQLREGHRHSADDLLVAWFAGEAARARGLRPARLLDLGAGIGSVGFMLAWQFPEARLVAVEAQAVSHGLSRRSAAYNGIEDRIDLRLGDFRDPPVLPEAAAFDVVTGSPPYFREDEGRVSDRPQRGPCRFEIRGGVEDYVAAGARALAPGGVFGLVMPTFAEARIEAAAAEAGLAVVDRLHVVFKHGRPPMLVLCALQHAGAPVEAPRPPLVLRDADDRRSEAFRAVRRAMGFPPGAW